MRFFRFKDKIEESTKYACPCCNFLTLEEFPGGTFNICPVCYWEDDNVQLADPDYEGGANRESLNQAKENFKLFGASSKRRKKWVRKPRPEEIPLKIPWMKP